MSRTAEIAAFIRLTACGLSTETLAKAIQRRWPDATEGEVRDALAMGAAPVPQNTELNAVRIGAEKI